MFWSRRSKRISFGGTWSKHKCFGRAGRNVPHLVELGRNLDFLVAPVETYLAWLNLVELGRNIKVLFMPVETYLAWSNLVET